MINKSIFCYQHNIEKYNDDTAGMSLIQHGAYRRLLDAYYKTRARLPQNHKELCRIVGCHGKAESKAVADVVSRFFTIGEDNFLRQNGAEKEFVKITKVSEEQRRKANLKHLKDKETAYAAAHAAAHAAAVPDGMPECCQLLTTNYQLEESKKERKEGRKEVPPPYQFEGKIIKLTELDFKRWEMSYKNINLLSELQKRDDWLSTQSPEKHKQWFCSTSSYFAKINGSVKTKKPTGHRQAGTGDAC